MKIRMNLGLPDNNLGKINEMKYIISDNTLNVLNEVTNLLLKLREVQFHQTALNRLIEEDQYYSNLIEGIQHKKGVLDCVGALNRSIGEIFNNKGIIFIKNILNFQYSIEPQKGGIRKNSVYIGKNINGKYVPIYTPMSAELVPSYMSDLEQFINVNDNLHSNMLLLKTILTHYQIESIHPFLDGNGRTGRGLIHMMLYKHGLVNSTYLLLSKAIYLNLDNYYQAFGKQREQNYYVQHNTNGGLFNFDAFAYPLLNMLLISIKLTKEVI